MQAALDNIYRNRAGSENLLRENTLRRWAAGSIGAEELGERASVLGWDLYCPRFCVLCMAPRKNGSLTVCRASVTALLKMQCQVEGFWDEKGRYTLILSGKTLNTEELSRQISELAAYEDFEKDAVMAFLEKIKDKVFASSDPQSQAFNDETFKNIQTSISATTSIEELSEALVGYDFRLAMLQVD